MVDNLFFQVNNTRTLELIADAWNNLLFNDCPEDWDVIDTSDVMEYDYENTYLMLSREGGLQFLNEYPDYGMEIEAKRALGILNHLVENGFNYEQESD